MSTPDDRDKLIAALDLHQPDWWIRLSSVQHHDDLLRFIKRAAISDELVARERDREIARCKVSVCSDLFVILRAGLEAGLVKLL